jgi:hypothetical protein
MITVSKEVLAVTDSEVQQLTVPNGVILAEIVAEADPTASDTDKQLIARFWQDGTDPNDSEGKPLAHFSILELNGFDMQQFKIIGVNTNQTVTLYIEYLR